MSEMKVQDLMVPNDAYATVSADGTIRDAVLALRKARTQERQQDPDRDRDRAVLVMWQAHIIGKVTMLDVVKSLGPRRYRGKTGASSLGPLVESMTLDFALRQKTLSRLVEEACKLSVRDLMRPYDKAETIAYDAGLDKALHQFISGEYQSLLVMADDGIIGILRLVDVYEHISEMIVSCGPEPGS